MSLYLHGAYSKLRAIATVGCAVSILLASAPSTTLSDRRSMRLGIGDSVLVSGQSPNVTHDEVLLASEPSGRQRLIACAITNPLQRGGGVAVYMSLDRGRTWSASFNLGGGAAESGGDPACVFGPIGPVLASLQHDQEGQKLAVYRLAGELNQWQAAEMPVGTNRNPAVPRFDRPYLTSDLSSDSPFHNRVYLYAQMRPQGTDAASLPMALTLWRSNDGGRSFEQPAQAVVLDRDINYWLGNSVVSTKGVFIAAVSAIGSSRFLADRRAPDSPRQANGTVECLRSVDGGATLEPLVKISDGYFDIRRNVQRSTAPSLAVDTSSSPFAGRLYVVWSDSRFYGQSRIVLSYSDDDGKSWCPPRTVSRLPSPISTAQPMHVAFMPAIAVNRFGIVAVSWYERVMNGENAWGYSVMLATSDDGGDTFGDGVQMPGAKHTVGASEQWRPYIFMRPPSAAQSPHSDATVEVRRDEWIGSGDTAGIAADADGVFHAAWIDNRTGVHQIWTANIEAPGLAIRNGDIALSALHDVTAQCAISLKDLSFDRATGILTASMELENRSAVALKGPLQLRITEIESPLAAPRLLNADNGLSALGAVLMFAPVAGGSIPPQGRTSSRQIRVLFEGVHGNAFLERGEFWPDWLRMSGRVLAADISRPTQNNRADSAVSAVAK